MRIKLINYNKSFKKFHVLGLLNGRLAVDVIIGLNGEYIDSTFNDGSEPQKFLYETALKMLKDRGEIL